MKKEIAILFSTGLLCLGVFFAIFSALQNKTIFEKTLENIAHTYERIETKESYKILKTPNPYVEVSDEKFLRWDAEIFGFIKDFPPKNPVNGRSFILDKSEKALGLRRLWNTHS